MKTFFPLTPQRRSCRRGFTLVEAVLAVGIMSFGFLALAPLLAVGVSGARHARENRATAQIAATMIEQAKQGAITSSGTFYFDSGGNPTTTTGVAYRVQESISSCAANSASGGPLNRLVLQVVPVDSAGAVRNYADVYVPAPSPAP